MKYPIRFAVAALLALIAVGAAADGVKFIDFIPVKGQKFVFLGDSGAGKTTVAVTEGYVVVGEGDDRIIADRNNRDIYTPGPNGDFISLRDMAAQFTGGATASGAASGASDTTDPDADFEALFEGMPPTMKRTFRAQLDSLPRDQAIMALKVMRGQMGLPPVDPGQLPQRVAPAAVDRTGNTENMNGLELHEYLVAGDQIWAVDADKMDGGASLVDGLVALGEIHAEIAAGLPTADSSFFRIGELDGRAPYGVTTQDGDTFTYESTTSGDIMVPKF